LRTQDFGSQLRSNFYTCDRRVFRNVTDLIYFNAGFACERGFQLLGKRSGLGVAGGKRAHKAGKLRLIERRSEVNACYAGCRQKLGEAAFRSSGA
jgi:hypothetical protein